MIDLQNPYAYEASLKNILHKVLFQREVGVQRVVITLLNDILSHLCKWPGLSAEDISKFDRTAVNDKYYGFRKMLTLSAPDVMILGDSVKAQRGSERIPPCVVIEVKNLNIDPDDNDVFTGTGAISLIKTLKDDPNTKDITKNIIKKILNVAFELPEGKSKKLKKNK